MADNNEENQEETFDNPSGGRSLKGEGESEPLPESWTRPSTQPRVGRIGAWGTSNSSSSGSRRIAGLQDLASASSQPSSSRPNPDDSDDDEGPQSFFAGGERSGISVEGPARRGGGNSIVRDILKKATRGGPPASTTPTSRSSAFAGGGHVLGSDEVPSSFIGDPEAASPTDSEEETAVRNITFWRDGFSVEDGPLLRYDVPENAKLLNDINTGHAPPSILNVRIGQPVELRVARRTDEDYVPPPKRPLAAFEGEGQRLGSPVPAIAGSAPSQSVPGAFPTSAPATNTETSSPSRIHFEVDQNAPTTSVQIRLADGTRLVARMNHTHTVGDIRNFINASRPGTASQAYTIGTTFPNRTLSDDTATIEAAGLKNTVVVQRMT